MAGKDRRGSDVEVVDAQIAEAGWQRLDLARTLSGLPAGRSDRGFAGLPLSFGVSERLPDLVFQRPGARFVAAAAAPADRRVPQEAFVTIGPDEGTARRGTAPGRRGVANDNRSSGDGRSVVRDIFFLAVLAATVAGAFWSGRVHGEQRVIVVPGPSSFYSVVT